MKLASLELTGFRGFPERRTFDLDADAVVVVGANGHGKTSLFDGILWCLSGCIPRLPRDASVVSLFSESGQAKAELCLKGTSPADDVTVSRTSDGANTILTVEVAGKVRTGPAAEGALIELLNPSAALADDPQDAIASRLAHSFYLQQDLVRDFVEATSVQQRFVAVSELLGAGRVTQLQASLERSKKAWSAATNLKEDELRPLRDRLNLIDGRLAELASASPTLIVTRDRWEDWWLSISDLKISTQRPKPSARDAPSAIDAALKQLDALRRSHERRLQLLEAVAADILEQSKATVADIAALHGRVQSAAKKLDDLKQSVRNENARLAELRRAQAVLRQKDAQLRTLAALALNHLDEHCPVCQQTYDREKTRIRLEGLINSAGSHGDSSGGESLSNLDRLLRELAGAEKELSDAQLAIRSAEGAASQRSAIEKSIAARLSELELAAPKEPPFSTQGLSEHVSRTKGLLARLAELQREGEQLALSLARASASQMIEELRREGDTLRRQYDQDFKAIAGRKATGERAQAVIEALRFASLAVVGERLGDINAVLQGIYARIDPHPAFRLVKFLSSINRGKGELATVVSDPITGKQSDVPAAVLSSSQLNALAVSVFFSLNIGTPHPALPIAILDDPIQSMDDINLLGLVDLLRRLKGKRQLLVSTHDLRFGELICRKLRPTTSQGRTLAISLEGWSRKGPAVVHREVKGDSAALKLVAAA